MLLLNMLAEYGYHLFYHESSNSEKRSQLTRNDGPLFVSLQVSSRLGELEATLDAGIRHRNKALADVGFHLTRWMNLVIYVDISRSA